MGGGYYLFGDSASPYSLTPTETLQWANIKQGFMKLELIWALKVCETCLGTKGRLSAWEQAKGISFSSHRLPCVFLIDRPRPHLIEMTCSWQGAPAFQVDLLSAGKLSPIWFMKKFDGGSHTSQTYCAVAGSVYRGLHLHRESSACGVGFIRSREL